MRKHGVWRAGSVALGRRARRRKPLSLDRAWDIAARSSGYETARSRGFVLTVFGVMPSARMRCKSFTARFPCLPLPHAVIAAL